MPASLITFTAYKSLLRDLRRQIAEGLIKIHRTLERQKVLIYWIRGRTIARFLLQERTLPREEIYNQLEEDLNINKRTLQQCVQFFSVYPKLNTKLALSWSHYRYLMTLSDPSLRKEWEARILKEGLAALELLHQLHEAKTRDLAEIDLSTDKDTTRGSLYTYRVIRVNYVQDNPGALMIDCGFDICVIPPPCQGKIDNTRIVESVKEKGKYGLVISNKTKEDIYAYKAMSERVIDGDTLLVNVDVGFGIFKRERLRLRGLDAPELGTALGNQAKRFVEQELRLCPFIVVKTYKNDKYDRYLVDVFYKAGELDPERVAAEGKVLNQELLQKDLAKKWV